MIALPFILNCLINFAVGIIVAKLLGPTEYGRFALIMSIAMVLQTSAFEWLRLSTTRFYSEQDRLERPEIRSTLDAGYLIVLGTALLVAVSIAVSGIHLPVSSELVALAIVTAGAVGLFEIGAALVRARLLHRSYAAFVIVKNILSLGLTAGGAWYFKSANFAIGGLILSILGSFVLCYPMMRDRRSSLRLVDFQLVRRFAAYGFPIVIANVFYLAIPMVNRGLVSQVHDFAMAGELALAYDIGTRIIGSIGAALDVLLFQVAVAIERTEGVDAGHRQISRNMGLILAVIAPAVVGCWLVLPSFEAFLIPQAFHGHFAHYFAIMLPGMLCGSLANYCIGPVFQITHRTAPLIWGGVAAFLANGIAVLFLPASLDATTYAVAQSASSCVGMFIILAFMCSDVAIWPKARDIAGTAAGVFSMLFVGLVLRGMSPGPIALIVQVATEGAIYAGCILACDVGDLRGRFAGILDFERRAPFREGTVAPSIDPAAVPFVETNR